MSHHVEWTKRALKEATRLDTTTRQRIFAALTRFCEDGQGDIRRLQGLDEIYRLRVGDWRIIFSFEDDLAVLVHRIRPRGDAYKE